MLTYTKIGMRKSVPEICGTSDAGSTLIERNIFILHNAFSHTLKKIIRYEFFVLAVVNTNTDYVFSTHTGDSTG